MWELIERAGFMFASGVGFGVGVMLVMGLVKLVLGKGPHDETGAQSLVQLRERNAIGRREASALECIADELEQLREDADLATVMYEGHHDLGGEAGGA